MKKSRFIPRGEWESLDWNRTAREIANDLDVAYVTVLRWAFKLGKTVREDQRGPDSKTDWSKVDWSLSSRELSERIGVSVRQIQKRRSELGFSALRKGGEKSPKKGKNERKQRS